MHLAAHSLYLRHIVDVRARPCRQGQNWLGTDDTKRDVLARVIYGFRLSICSR